MYGKKAHRKGMTARAVGLSCESVELWLADHRRDDPMPAAVSHHLGDCPHCALERTEALPLRELMTGDCKSNRPERFSGRRLDGRDADPLFVRAVMSRVREELPPLRRRQARQSRVFGGAAAAVALLALGLGLLFVGDDLVFLSGGVPGGGAAVPESQIGSNTTPPLAVSSSEGSVEAIGFHPVFIPDESLQVVKF